MIILAEGEKLFKTSTIQAQYQHNTSTIQYKQKSVSQLVKKLHQFEWGLLMIQNPNFSRLNLLVFSLSLWIYVIFLYDMKECSQSKTSSIKTSCCTTFKSFSWKSYQVPKSNLVNRSIGNKTIWRMSKR